MHLYESPKALVLLIIKEEAGFYNCEKEMGQTGRKGAPFYLKVGCCEHKRLYMQIKVTKGHIHLWLIFLIKLAVEEESV